MKRCPKCSTVKEAKEFSVSVASKDGLGSYCKDCAKSYNKKRYREKNVYAKILPAKRVDGKYHCRHCNQYFDRTDMHISKQGEYEGATYCKNCAPVVRNMRQLKKYGLTIDQYMTLLESQNYSCKLCQRQDTTFRKRLSVDHDHNCCPGESSCGKCIRGLLCHHCNAGLGNVKDSIETLQKMINYLQSGYVDITQKPL